MSNVDPKLYKMFLEKEFTGRYLYLYFFTHGKIEIDLCGSGPFCSGRIRIRNNCNGFFKNLAQFIFDNIHIFLENLQYLSLAADCSPVMYRYT
jgi:hypothetical protein